MATSAEQLLDDALRLPPEARAALACRLLESLETDVDEDAEAVTVATRDGFAWRVPRAALEPHPLRFAPGDRVVAQWADTQWYEAVVTAIDGARAQVTFEDGSTEWIPFAGLVDESTHG